MLIVHEVNGLAAAFPPARACPLTILCWCVASVGLVVAKIKGVSDIGSDVGLGLDGPLLSIESDVPLEPSNVPYYWYRHAQ